MIFSQPALTMQVSPYKGYHDLMSLLCPRDTLTVLIHVTSFWTCYVQSRTLLTPRSWLAPHTYLATATAAFAAMALTSAVVNAAAAAAAAGAGKKAAQVQLQAELNTDEDWNKFLQRDGLLGE